MTEERKCQIESSADVKDFIKKINDHGINVTETEFKNVIYSYCEYMTLNQREVFINYYCMHKSIKDIRYNLNFRSYNDVERTLASSEKRMLKMLEIDFGLVN